MVFQALADCRKSCSVIKLPETIQRQSHGSGSLELPLGKVSSAHLSHGLHSAVKIKLKGKTKEIHG